MGYTHYYCHAPRLDGKALFAAFQDARKIVEAAKAKGIQLRGGNGTGEPVIEECIYLNGAEELGEDCETFYFPVTGEDLKYSMANGGFPWAFCKTQRQPYDIVVCAILLVLKHHLKDQLGLASDGNRRPDEWLKAEALVKKVLGYIVHFKQDYDQKKEKFRKEATCQESLSTRAGNSATPTRT